jgi:hypothetical protein
MALSTTSTVMAGFICCDNSPLGPLMVTTFSGETLTVTLSGITIGFLPILDIFFLYV